MAKKWVVDKAAIVVHRDKKAVRVEPGKPFEFTETELADIKAAGHEVRAPKNEDPDVYKKDDGGSNTGAGLTDDEIQNIKTNTARDLLLNKITNKSGKIELSDLNDALNKAGVADVTAAERDALQEAIEAESKKEDDI